ncbi:hypothetical protein BO79DRAFT_29662 [Aspergillus costaricaensis CBS 115574]|uniref:Uncharacterized protein n=1 Tax=Aspergillus costaricaensis CBS 115574 TaxID=1448317 RepID=A0ACD1IB14_9EURO|nr:hypothetical protein BO79DRAFT_29662 [Aspergillus costaricaensis CBS 115574]RAK87277.1 hypothetical protein BO79DRAFT_29662 [Aspergillus costaricaensis CBS 115574]
MVSPYSPGSVGLKPGLSEVELVTRGSFLTYLLSTTKAVGPACHGWARSRRSNAAIGDWKRSCKERIRFHPSRSHSVRLCNPPIRIGGGLRCP